MKNKILNPTKLIKLNKKQWSDGLLKFDKPENNKQKIWGRD